MIKVKLVSGMCLLGALAAVAAATFVGCSSNDNNGGDASTCSAPLLQCGNECTDPQSDPNNCGNCGTKCNATNAEVCSQGTCALSCGGGTTKCGSSCFDTQNDQKNCGSCGNACAQGETCSAGKCGIACSAGLTQCGDAGGCIDTNTDALDCGACGNVCGPNTTCQAGACTANLLTTAPVAVSGTLTNCTMANAGAGRKAAIDGANDLFVAMNCGGTLYVATSTNGGISFGAPVSTGLTNVTEAAIVAAYGAKPSLYVGAIAANTIVFTASGDLGKTFSASVTVDSASSGGGFGLSMDVYKNTVYVQSNPQGGGNFLHILRNGTGAGDAGLADASDAGWELTNLFVDSGGLGVDPNDIAVNQSNGDVWAMAEVGTYLLMQSTNGGASWTGPSVPPGSNFYTDWVLAKNTIFQVGTGDLLTAIPTATPTTDTTVAGLGGAGSATRALAVDIGGNVYVATPNGNGVRVDHVLFAAATSDGGADGGAVIQSTRNLPATGSVTGLAITSRPLGAALVAWTTGGVAYASVQAY